MTDLEELVRTTLASRAADAPSPAGLADSVRLRRRRSRQGRQAAAVVGVAAATAAAVVIPLTLTHQHASPAPPDARPATTSGEQVIGFHGIEITVPRSWHINDLECGTPIADTVVRDTGGSALCGIARPPKVNSVELVPSTPAFVAQLRNGQTRTNAHGVQVRTAALKGRGVGVDVPAAGVIAFVQTVSPAVTTRIVDSISVVDVDTTGCKMRETQLQPPLDGLVRRGPYIPYVISPAATSIAVCHYEDRWLVSSAVATGKQLAALVRQANSAPQGFVHAPPADYLPSVCTDAASAGGEAGTGFILLAHIPGGVTQRLWAHIGFCGPLGITNGGRAGALTQSLASAITAPLHSGFAMPGRLLPGAP